MRYLLTLILSAFLVWGGTVHAQLIHNPCGSKKSEKWFEKGKASANKGKPDKAIAYWERSWQECREWDLPMTESALLREKAGDFAAAEELIERLLRYRKDRPALYYRLAVFEKKQQKYGEAIEHFEKFLADVEDNPLLVRRANELLASARFADWAIRNPVPFDPEKLGPAINTPGSEYLPVLDAEESTMYFTRREQRREDLYVSHRRQDEWQEAGLIREITGIPFRKGAFSISPDGRMIMFAMADHPGGHGGFDLYYMMRDGQSWSKPRNLGRRVNTPAWESQPSIGPDGRTVFFSTNRKGGEGGHDIWRTRLNVNGKWERPANLGPAINTRRDEESPYIHRDGRTLYFRSDGHPGMGDFDLFVSRKKDDSGWTIARNLGYPINTRLSEGGIYVSMDGSTAYYASDREYLGREDLRDRHTDIYRFTIPEDLRPRPSTYVLAEILDKTNGRPVNATAALLDWMGRDTLYWDRTGEEGRFLACLSTGRDYALHVFAKGYVFHSERFELSEINYPRDPYLMQIYLQPVREEKDTSAYVLKNVLFETGSYRLHPSSTRELDYLAGFLNQHPSIRIEIRGHTDNVGTATDNEALSRNRAKAVYEYLVGRSIDPGRLTYRGFGERRPVAPNDTAGGRRQNRRTEFVISSQ